jgi:hypothetical protein
MTKVYLCTATYIYEVPDDFVYEDEFEIYRKSAFIERTFVNGEDKFHWTSSLINLYDTEKDNIGKCANCGRWTTNREADNSPSDICNGAIVDGILLCDQCLPKDHIWAC